MVDVKDEEYFIKEYISNNINISNNPLKEFINFCSYISTKKIMLTEKKIENLLDSNSKLKLLLELLVDKYRKIIATNSFDEFLLNEEAVFIFEIYCMKNNIPLFDDQSIDNIVTKDYDDNFKIYLDEINKFKTLSTEEINDLIKKASNGDKESKQKVVNSNLKLVVSIAKRYQNSGLNIMDLIQEGSIGLMSAVDKFDPSKGFKFSTYASSEIKWYIIRAINNIGSNIRIPIYLSYKFTKYTRFVDDFIVINDRYPSLEELKNGLEMNEQEIIELQKHSHYTVSYNNFVINEKGEKTELLSLIPDNEELIENEIIISDLKENVNNFIKGLNITEREKTILLLAFGFNGRKPLTLVEIGKIYNLSRERVRQIIEKILKIARMSNNIEEFSIYMDKPKDANEWIEKYKINNKKKIKSKKN